MPATDEIYEKYLQKAIVEINDLAHEVAQAGGGTRVRFSLPGASPAPLAA